MPLTSACESTQPDALIPKSKRRHLNGDNEAFFTDFWGTTAAVSAQAAAALQQVEVPDVGAAVEAKKAEVKMHIEP